MLSTLIGKKIFILEDNSMNRIVFRISLITQGALVEFDIWGRETIEKITKYNPDLIILDLMLPNGESGYTVFQQIREHSEYDNIPIVAISASEPAIALPKTKKMGFSGFIAKPIDESIFPQQMAKILEGEAIWSAGERFGTHN